jgi:PD-(D/E)XK nuclease superfamily
MSHFEAPKKRENRSGSRWYNVGGLEYPSVTTILQVIGKPALIAWSAKVEREMVSAAAATLYVDLAGTPKMSSAAYLISLNARIGTTRAAQKELTKSAEIGSQAHKLIEWNLRASLMQEAGPSPHITDKAMWAFMAWEDWKKSVNLKTIWVEQTIWSDKYGYAGTMDLLAEVNGILTVVDWKTGKAIYPEAYLQNAAYRSALREMGHGDAKQGLIVRLPKNTEDPEFEAKIVEEPEEKLMETFLHAFELWKWNQIGEDAYQAKLDAKKAVAT